MGLAGLIIAILWIAAIALKCKIDVDREDKIRTLERERSELLNKTEWQDERIKELEKCD